MGTRRIFLRGSWTASVLPDIPSLGEASFHISMNLQQRFSSLFAVACQMLLFVMVISVVWNGALAQSDNATNANGTVANPTATTAAADIAQDDRARK